MRKKASTYTGSIEPRNAERRNHYGAYITINHQSAINSYTPIQADIPFLNGHIRPI